MFLRKLSKFWKQTVDTKPELTIAPWGLKSQVNYFLSQVISYSNLVFRV